MLSQYINLNKLASKSDIRLFYSLSLFIALDRSEGILKAAFQVITIVPLWPIGWMGTHPDPGTFLYVYLFVIGAWFATILVPGSRLIRLNAALGWLLYFSMANKDGTTGNMLLPWVMVSIIMGLVSFSPQLQRVYGRRICQAALLSCYFNSGLWKLRAMTTLFGMQNPWESLGHTISEHIAYGAALGSPIGAESLIFFTSHPVLAAAALILVIGLQLSTIFWIFFPQYNWLWAMLILGFHYSTTFTLGPHFGLMSLLGIYLFLVPEDQTPTKSEQILVSN